MARRCGTCAYLDALDVKGNRRVEKGRLYPCRWMFPRLWKYSDSMKTETAPVYIRRRPMGWSEGADCQTWKRYTKPKPETMEP